MKNGKQNGAATVKDEAALAKKADLLKEYDLAEDAAIKAEAKRSQVARKLYELSNGSSMQWGKDVLTPVKREVKDDAGNVTATTYYLRRRNSTGVEVIPGKRDGAA